MTSCSHCASFRLFGRFFPGTCKSSFWVCGAREPVFGRMYPVRRDLRAFNPRGPARGERSAISLTSPRVRTLAPSRLFGSAVITIFIVCVSLEETRPDGAEA